ncbi:MAG: beta-ketoacyl-ACP synthase II [Bacteroidetes bacterium]|jgi:3-oxoacyl-[acyl-carrier-protein] synthase II|nr:beta-ketoacyl-ACP synthase II [Bacteroidota bacterium]
MQLRRVVVTGLGTLTPIGNTKDDFQKKLFEGVSGANLITRFDASNFKTKFACELKDFNPADYMDRKEARKFDRYTQMAMVCADEAVQDAGIDTSSIDQDRYGVIWGSGIGGIESFEEEVKNYVTGDGTPRFNPFFITKMISDMAGGYISIKYGFRGPNFTTVAACASSSVALIDALTYIRLNKADVMLAGGSEASVTVSSVGGFNAMKALSTNNDDYKRASRPFDKTRDGFVVGEGAGCLVLEELEHAKKRGATIYAEIVGGGLSADAYHITAPHPEGIGAANVMKSALQDAQINKEDVDYVNVHGTSTPAGDIAEIKAIQRLFEDHAFNLNISATKSMTGHLLGAAGAIESIATIFAVKNNMIPPTINHEHHDDEIDSKLNLTLNQAQEREVNYGICNTFGFGGHNTCVVVKKYT